MVEQLERRAALIILDNCEHVLATASRLAHRLLTRCPGVGILATSRAPLACPGEEIWRIEPLGLVEESVQLFIERGRALIPKLHLEPVERQTVGEICRLLDGMPLGIELAAARLSVLSPAEILHGLRTNPRLLRASDPTAAERHHSMQGLLDWSHGLLAPAEQVALARLSVFAGSFDVSVAGAVIGHDAIAPDDAPDLIWSLADQSLVTVDRGAGATRYRLLETVRAYAAQKLDDAGDAALTRARLAQHYLARFPWARVDTAIMAQRVRLRGRQHRRARRSALRRRTDRRSAGPLAADGHPPDRARSLLARPRGARARHRAGPAAIDHARSGSCRGGPRRRRRRPTRPRRGSPPRGGEPRRAVRSGGLVGTCLPGPVGSARSSCDEAGRPRSSIVCGRLLERGAHGAAQPARSGGHALHAGPGHGRDGGPRHHRRPAGSRGTGPDAGGRRPVVHRACRSSPNRTCDAATVGRPRYTSASRSNSPPSSAQGSSPRSPSSWPRASPRDSDTIRPPCGSTPWRIRCSGTSASTCSPRIRPSAMRCTARPQDQLGPDRFATLVQEGRQLSRLQALELAEDVFAMATSALERRRSVRRA